MKITNYGEVPTGVGGSSPLGVPAGGDLSGGPPLPAPIVSGILGFPIVGSPALHDHFEFDGSEWIFVPAAAGSLAQVKVDGADTTQDYLAAKLAAGPGIALAVLGAGGAEQVQIASIPGYGDREVLMASGVSFPADPIEASVGGDWLYGLV